ST
ncbi:hypothetical protein KFL_001560165, partial [Klebsormidium nitens]